jgi:predicted nucleotidyltransferase
VALSPTHPPQKPDARLAAIARAASTFTGLDLLLLFGSRARADHHAQSDWDFAFLGRPDLDVTGLAAVLVAQLDTDHVDLVDLASANGLLRYRAAVEGVVLFERPPAHEIFCLDAVRFWADAEPIVNDAYEALLRANRR